MKKVDNSENITNEKFNLKYFESRVGSDSKIFNNHMCYVIQTKKKQFDL